VDETALEEAEELEDEAETELEETGALEDEAVTEVDRVLETKVLEA
jgi:hypothetical protein